MRGDNGRVENKAWIKFFLPLLVRGGEALWGPALHALVKESLWKLISRSGKLPADFPQTARGSTSLLGVSRLD